MSNLTRSTAVSALLALLLLAIVGADASGPRIYPRTWRKVPVPSRFWVARGGASEPDSTAADGEPVQISEPIQSEDPASPAAVDDLPPRTPPLPSGGGDPPVVLRDPALTPPPPSGGGDPPIVLRDPHTLFLTDDDKMVYELLDNATTTDKLLSSAARIPAVRECPDYHLQITNAGRSDAFLAAFAVARLANISRSEGEMQAVISDRRFGQLIECISCQSSSLSLVDISNTLFGFSVLRCREDSLLRSLTDTAIKALNTSQLPDVVTLAWSAAHASALLGFASEGLLDHVASRVLMEWQQLSPPDVSKLAWSLAVAGKPIDPLMRAIGDTAATSTAAFGIRDLTHVAWSLSTLGYRNTTVRDAIATSSLGRMAELPVEDLAKLARSLAVWGTSHDVLLLELLICAEAKRADLEPSHTADVLWALGRANFRNASAFLARELPDVYQRMDTFAPQDLVKVLWSYATLLQTDDAVAPILSSLAGRASVIIERMTAELEPVFLAQAIWALATLGLYSQELCIRVATVLEKRVSELGVSEITSLAWAFAKLGSPRNPLFDQLAALVESRHVDFTPRELSQCLWGLAVCGYKLHFHTPLHIDEAGLRELKPSEVSSLLWAVAKVSAPHPPRDVMDCLCRDVKTKLATFSPHDLTQVAWALSALDQRGHKVVSYISKAVRPWLESFTPKQLATITDALLHLKTPQHDVLDAIKAEMERRLLALLTPAPTSTDPTVPPPPPLTAEQQEVQRRSLFHLCRCQQMLLHHSAKQASLSDDGKPARAVDGEKRRKRGRWKYEIGKRALSSLF